MRISLYLNIRATSRLVSIDKLTFISFSNTENVDTIAIKEIIFPVAQIDVSVGITEQIRYKKKKNIFGFFFPKN